MKIVTLALMLLAATVSHALAGPAVSNLERSALQAAMAQHIDRQTVDGQFLYVDFTQGTVERLSPAKAHPMILKMGDDFVLCTDFVSKNGKAVNIDFYLARRGKGYVIFHTEVGNRGSLEAMMKAGKVAMID